MTDDAVGENGGALMSDPVDVIIDKLLRYVRPIAIDSPCDYRVVNCM